MGTWKEQYTKAMHGHTSMLRLLRCGLAAVQESGNGVLCSQFPVERIVAPYALCDALDAFGVPSRLVAMSRSGAGRRNRTPVCSLSGLRICH